jgi:hypothetical protein
MAAPVSDRAKHDGFMAAATKLSPLILRAAHHPWNRPYTAKDQEAAADRTSVSHKSLFAAAVPRALSI